MSCVREIFENKQEVLEDEVEVEEGEDHEFIEEEVVEWNFDEVYAVVLEIMYKGDIIYED